jgi:hypothetical protein
VNKKTPLENVRQNIKLSHIKIMMLLIMSVKLIVKMKNYLNKTEYQFKIKSSLKNSKIEMRVKSMKRKKIKKNKKKAKMMLKIRLRILKKMMRKKFGLITFQKKE